MKNKTLSLSLIALMLTLGMAMQAQIKGTVLEEGTGEPVIGASILQVGTTNGVITDFDGNFEINVPEGADLQFSYMGFASQTLPAKKGMVVKLAEDTHQLQEVVAIGYGSQKKKEVTGSVSSLKAEDFNPGVKSDPMGLLQGRVAGLTVIRAGGDDPTSTGFAVQIRGTSSLGKGTGGSPLYIVDGVPVTTIDNIAPEEIASMDVLKDGSAAAIYGTRGTNGVVIITTKRGLSDPNMDKGVFNVEYSGYVSAAMVATKTGMATADEYRQVESMTGGWIRTKDYGYNTDWYGMQLRKAAVTHHHNVAMAGAVKNFSYRAAVAYKDAQGIAQKNSRQEIQAKFAADQKAFEGWLKLQYDFSYMHYKNNNFQGNLNNGALLNPTMPVVNADGSYYIPTGTVTDNPIADNADQEKYNDGNAFHGSVKAIVDIKAVPGLKVSGFASLDETDWYEYWRSHKNFYVKDNANKASRNTSRTFNQLYEATIDYAGQWGGHTLTLVGGGSYQNFWYDKSSMWNGNFATDASGYYRMGDAQIDKAFSGMSSERSENTLVAFFARANYNYNEKYLFSASIRAEGSSKFGANNKWGYFPAASAGWRIKGEDFMRDQDWCNDLKVRFGFGITGNNVDQSLRSIEMMTTEKEEFNNHGETAYSYKVCQNPNPDLKWERKFEYNLGIDFSFLQNRLSGTMDFYLRNTKDLLWEYTVPTPPYQFGTLLANAGEMTSMGMEYSITGIPVQTKDWTWTSTWTMSFNKNRIDKLSDPSKGFNYDEKPVGDASGNGHNNTKTQVLREGHPVGSWYGYKWTGQFDQYMRCVYEDLDGNGIIDDNDKTYLGSAQPKMEYGWNNTIRWKDLDISFFFRGNVGNLALNVARFNYSPNKGSNGLNVFMYDVRNFGKSTTYKQVEFSSYYLEDASYLKLDNITIGYNIPIPENKYCQKLRVNFTIQNVFTISKYTGMDPARINTTSVDAAGVDYVDFYPSTRQFQFGVNATF